MDVTPNFEAALARLDVDIEAAETRLNDLRLKRTGALVFLDYFQGETSAVPVAEKVNLRQPRSDGDGAGPTDLVLAAVRRMTDEEFNLDRLVAEIESNGGGLEREQTRNAVHYLVRKGDLRNARRGVYARPTDTGTPAATGVPVSGQSISDWPSEEGGIRHDTEPLRDHDQHPGSRDAGRTHDLRAPMREVTG